MLRCAQSGSRTRTPIRTHGPQPCLSTSSSTWAIWLCDLAGARTQDPLLKREMLYQLSYQVIKLIVQIYNLFNYWMPFEFSFFIKHITISSKFLINITTKETFTHFNHLWIKVTNPALNNILISICKHFFTRMVR